MSNCKFVYGHGLRGKYPVPSEKPANFEMVREPGNAILCGYSVFHFYIPLKISFYIINYNIY
ncbi:MAG: hypothetical protein HWN81_06890 [Candidatus Lokiarchaeota archaeon]|nr:hypothetical protein [Candidatus Lokiarchaeota archaeon]